MARAREPEVEEFAERVRALKDRSGRSYGALARRLNISASTLYRYASGEAVPAEFTPVERLARLCGVSADERVRLQRLWILADAVRRPSSTATRGAHTAPAPAPASASASASASETPEAPETVETAETPEFPEAPDTPDQDSAAPTEHAEQTSPAPYALPAPPAPYAPEPSAGRQRTPTPFRARRRWAALAAAVVTAAVGIGIGLGTLAASNPGSESGSRSGSSTAPGAGPGSKAAAGEGTEAEAEAETEPGAGPGTETGTEAGGRTGTEAGPEPGAEAGTKGGAETPPTRNQGSPTDVATPEVPFTWTAKPDLRPDGCGHTFLADRDPADVPAPPTQAPARWVSSQSAVQGAFTQLRVTVQGASPDRAVVLEALRVRVTQRAAPLEWNVYTTTGGCGGALTPRRFDVNLDKPRPRARPVAGFDGEAQREIPAVSFPYTVTSDDPEVLLVQASTATCDCRWSLELEWSAEGRSGTVEITDENGQPFRTSGIKDRPFFGYDDATGRWLAQEQG
ncbi:helix-turn-helix domain-containing protein [Streptomyces apocyni]|uniref:helix-turn-helix domain-containing protein n=1 Tax=Streptomyces apocyni TaxID=2654677 RepID=UPI0012E9E475|nr:helix-turn-helix transcriptional regulator [Streptomyces apocyni]